MDILARLVSEGSSAQHQGNRFQLAYEAGADNSVRFRGRLEVLISRENDRFHARREHVNGQKGQQVDRASHDKNWSVTGDTI